MVLQKLVVTILLSQLVLTALAGLEEVEPDLAAGHEGGQDFAYTRDYGGPHGERQPDEHWGPDEYSMQDEYPRHEKYPGHEEYPGRKEYSGPKFYYPETPNLLKRRFEQQQEGYNSPNYGVPPATPTYYGYDAVCDSSKGVDYKAYPGLPQTAPGNLGQAFAFCPPGTLQVGGYCSVACRAIGVAQTNVNQLGATSGWYSDDTRDDDGTLLNGLTKSYPGYFFGLQGTATDDTNIGQQIDFFNYQDGATSTGVMRLWATAVNLGKASVRYYEPWVGPTYTPITSGSSLATLTAEYRWYTDPQPTPRTPAFNMRVVGANGISYSLSYVPNGFTAAGWHTTTLDSTTVGWMLYCNVGCPGDSRTFSMESLLADPTWGSRISGGSVVGVGFNLGSYQRECYIGIDYLKTSLLNSGNMIFFGKGGAQSVTFPTVAMGGATIGGATGSAFAPPNGWTWGPAPPTIPPPEPYAQYGQTRCFGPAVTAAGTNAVCFNIAVAACCTPRASTTT